MRRMTLVVLLAVGVGAIHAATRTIDFNQDAIDQAPKGFEFGHTAGVGKPGKWIVQAVVLYKVARGKRTDLPLKGAGRT